MNNQLSDDVSSRSHGPNDMDNVHFAWSAKKSPLPYNMEAEKALLGAIMLDPRALEVVEEFLQADHFSVEEHGKIFDVCRTLIGRGQNADPVNLARFFETSSDLEAFGGAHYLAELSGSAVSVINAEHYGLIIRDCFLRRRLIQISRENEERACLDDGQTTAEDIIEANERQLYDLASSGVVANQAISFDKAIVNTLTMAEIAHKRDGSLAGLSTGLQDLDDILGGLVKSDLLILAGRPSMGKTALVTNIAYNVAEKWIQTNGAEGAPVGFFSMEMSHEQLTARILSSHSNIDNMALRRGNLSTDEFTNLVTTSQKLSELPLFIDDTPALTVSALRTRARRLKRQHGLGLIVVDYLQLMSPAPSRNNNQGRVNEVTEITAGLKTIAKELDVPVIALSQLSRAVEQREPPRPQLSDLRESGSIEQDADIVMFVYRPEYYAERKKPARRADDDDVKFLERQIQYEELLHSVKGLGEVIFGKHRHGPIGDVVCHFEGKTATWKDKASSPFSNSQNTMEFD